MISRCGMVGRPVSATCPSVGCFGGGSVRAGGHKTQASTCSFNVSPATLSLYAGITISFLHRGQVMGLGSGGDFSPTTPLVTAL